RAQKRSVATCHRIESEPRGGVGAAIGDRLCTRNLFSGSTQQSSCARKQGSHAHGKTAKSLAITVNAAGVGQAVPIADIGTAIVGAPVNVGVGRSIIARQRPGSRE